MPFPPPKKSGPAVVIGIKPSSGPPPLKAPGSKYGDDDSMQDDAAPSQEHESMESPTEEMHEDQGGDLLTDAMKPLTELGLQEDHAKDVLAQIFEAAAKCLKGGGAPGSEDPGMYR